MQKLLNSEIDKRVVIKLDKTMRSQDDGVNGLMTFGQNNDYPQTIEKLIGGSTTGKAVSNIYAKFLVGNGFENEEINNIVVGTDSRGKKITVLSLLREVAISISKFNGFYIHTNITQGGKVKNVHLKPFKNVRIAKPDGTGYSAKVCYYENWEKDKDKGRYDKKDIKIYNVFNLKENVITQQIIEAGGIEKYKGQIYFEFLDNEYFYPLSKLDSVYMDLDSEAQISLYKNRQLRDGFLDKIVFRVAPGGTEQEQKDLANNIRAFVGADGDTVLILEDDLDTNGEVKENGSFRIDKIESNVNDKLFENWEKSLMNSIRKAGGGLPAVLIDYEQSSLGNTSGESVKAACDYYNALTEDDRAVEEKAFQEIFSNSENEVLRNNTNWKIKPLNLAEYGTIIEDDLNEEPEDVNALAQASLRGSVGGVQGILQIQQGVTSGTTDRDAAIEILKEIYGFTQEKSEAILGTPKQKDGTIDDNTTAND